VACAAILPAEELDSATCFTDHGKRLNADIVGNVREVDVTHRVVCELHQTGNGIECPVNMRVLRR